MNDEENIYNEIFSSHTKRCSTCQQILPLTEYYKDKSKPDGYKSVCTPCYLIHKKRRYYSNLEVERDRQIEKYRAKKRYPKVGYCYKIDNGSIVKIINIKKGKYPLLVIDVESLTPKSDVTQYSITVWGFRKEWQGCNNPLQ
jgi:hypothetical protein